MIMIMERLIKDLKGIEKFMGKARARELLAAVACDILEQKDADKKSKISAARLLGKIGREMRIKGVLKKKCLSALRQAAESDAPNEVRTVCREELGKK